jgi:hypothetical protein
MREKFSVQSAQSLYNATLEKKTTPATTNNAHRAAVSATKGIPENRYVSTGT